MKQGDYIDEARKPEESTVASEPAVATWGVSRRAHTPTDDFKKKAADFILHHFGQAEHDRMAALDFMTGDTFTGTAANTPEELELLMEKLMQQAEQLDGTDGTWVTAEEMKKEFDTWRNFPSC